MIRFGEKPLSESIIDFVNSKKSRSIFSRKELIEYLGNSIKYFNLETMDTYRRVLTDEGYLSKTDKRGIYKVNRKIPKGESITNMRNGQQAWKASRPYL